MTKAKKVAWHLHFWLMMLIFWSRCKFSSIIALEIEREEARQARRTEEKEGRNVEKAVDQNVKVFSGASITIIITSTILAAKST